MSEKAKELAVVYPLVDDVKVDDEFEGLLRKLTDDEFARLEASIGKEGMRDPVLVWRASSTSEPVVVDGHNRRRIARRNRMKFPVKEVSFPSRNAVMKWIKDTQLGRRNMTKEEKMELLAAKASGKKGSNQATSEKGSTVSDVAKEHGVSERTVSRAKELDKVVGKIQEKFGNDVKKKIVAGAIKLTEAQKRELAELEVEPGKKVIEDLGKGMKAKSAFERHRPGVNGEASEATSKAAVPEPDLVDANGVKVPADLKDIFASQVTAECVSSIRKIKTLVTSMMTWNRHLPGSVRNDLEEIAKTVIATQPTAVCWHCHGKKCEHCKHSGFMSRAIQEAEKGPKAKA